MTLNTYPKVVLIAICVNGVYFESSEQNSAFSLPKIAHILVNNYKLTEKASKVESELNINLCISMNKQKLTQKDDFNASEMKVGIIGAGISGLYAALLLQDLGINYEILEASNRIGGRYRTFHFDSSFKYNYVELGAMRFPKIPEFDRLIGKQNWSLINYLNSKVNEMNKLKLIPFLLAHPNNIFHFNGRDKYRSEVESSGDLFGFGKNDGGFIDEKYTVKGASFWINKAFDFIREQLNGNLSSGYDFLLSNDYKTFRGFLTDPKISEFAYPSDVVDWIENINCDTGEFSYSFMNTYLDLLLFSEDMVTIDGGVSKLIQAITAVLRNKPKLNMAVKRVQQQPNKNLVVVTNSGQFLYTHLIMTPTFPVLRDIDFDCELHLKKRIAMRTIENAYAVKVGLQFRTRFWENATLMNNKPIFGGASFTDSRIRIVTYPSFGINCSSCYGSLLVSYTLFRDSVKFMGFSDEEVVRICLRDLSEIHGEVVYEQFSGEYAIMNWPKHKWTQGAFSAFEPGYFMSYYSHLIHPDPNGRLHFAGETLSVYHGWSIGAIISGYRSVKDILAIHGMKNKIKQLESKWEQSMSPISLIFNNI